MIKNLFKLYFIILALILPANADQIKAFEFTEEELKDIVSNSVKKALEKSIATSLVELAVSELKTKVNQMDQDWA